MKVTIIHLDLGIGGAEQLIVSIAKNLQDLGHEVTILTSHHDAKHCFEETKPDGCLGNSVYVYGDWLPRHIFGKFTAFFAIFRMLWLALMTIMFYRSATDLVFIDGVSAPVPLLRLFGIKVLFYCHFPDMLLCTDRKNIFKRYYRVAIDAVEEWTTGCANLILVNSEFTSGMFKAAFTSLGKQVLPAVLYPVVSEIPPSKITEIQSTLLQHIPYTHGYEHVFVSLNRYERKKNIFLAIDAATHLKSTLQALQSKQEQEKRQFQNPPPHRVLLVVAGGYDLRVAENVEYLQELMAHCQSVGMPHKYIQQKDVNTIAISDSNNSNNNSPLNVVVDIVFRTSISSTERTALLVAAKGLLYTPDQEHFGIVPLEAMYLSTPVIAVNSGGPRETVIDGVTGYLCERTAEEFSGAMFKLLQNNDKRPFNNNSGTSSTSSIIVSMGDAAHEHVKAKFTNTAMKVKLQEYIVKAVKK